MISMMEEMRKMIADMSKSSLEHVSQPNNQSRGEQVQVGESSTTYTKIVPQNSLAKTEFPRFEGNGLEAWLLRA